MYLECSFVQTPSPALDWRQGLVTAGVKISRSVFGTEWGNSLGFPPPPTEQLLSVFSKCKLQCVIQAVNSTLKAYCKVINQLLHPN